MDNEQLEKLSHACVVIGSCLAESAKSVAELAAFLEDNLSDQLDDVDYYHAQDSIDTLIQAIEKIREVECLADYADDIADIDMEEIPRPPKRIGPVNKANYTYNRPQRRARSSCRIIKR